MNKRIRALLRKQPNLAAFARKSKLPYWTLYYFMRTPSARMTVDVAEKVLKAVGGGK